MGTNDHDVVESRVKFVLERSEAFAQSPLHPYSSDCSSGLSAYRKPEPRMIQFIRKCIDEKRA